MSKPPDSIIMNSCEYTPIYLIPSTSVTQAGSYIITQSSQVVQKPVADNLKTFYENSGKLESGILSSSKPRILKKHNTPVVGNNLKVASFLLPKSDINVNVQNITTIANIPSIQPKKLIAPVTNVIVKPVATAIPASSIVTAVEKPKNDDSNIPIKPLVEIDRKIVRVGTIPNTTRTHYPRVLPKYKPKEKVVDPIQSKHTSVQLIKLGETYHSLNQLSEAQMKIVNKALKMFSDPEKIPQEAAYDPVTNTKFIYKVVSPRDLTVVGRNKVGIKKKSEMKRTKVANIASPPPAEEEPETPAEPKVTRSGRTVKLPKQMRPGLSPQKPKRKVGSVVNCFQCSAEFCSFYRLQRHYEMFPTHIPARIHSNMFHCLLAIIKGGSEEDQANIFIQQIEQLIEKIKSLWPCLLKKMEGKDGKLCTINEDIGRLFGVSPGKYNINIDALNCVKDKDGHCIHNPTSKHNFNSETVGKHSQKWNSKHNEEVANNEADTEDCARINSVDKWPTVNKRIWKLKQQKQSLNAKKMRLASESDQQIELGIDDIPIVAKDEKCAIIVKNDVLENLECPKVEAQQSVAEPKQPSLPTTIGINIVEKPYKTHTQFHSTHFDIRSSPIKLPSSLVRKFQLHPNKESNLEVQILRPLTLDKSDTDNQAQAICDLQEVFSDNIQLPKETSSTMNNEIDFNSTKDWSVPPNEESVDNFIKSNILFETGLTPEKNSTIEPLLLHSNDKQNYLLETPNKSKSVSKTNNDKLNEFIEPLVLHDDKKDNNFFGSNQRLIDQKDDSNDFYEPGVRVKPKVNTLIGSSVINLKALSNVKERSNNLFGTSSLQPSSKSNNEIEPSLLNSLFDTSLLHMKDRNNLFESSLLEIKDKDLLDSSLLQDDNSNLFSSKENDLIGHDLVDDKSHSFDVSMLDTKNDVSNSVNIDVNQSNNLSANDSRLLSNQGQSVLNFLDSLGNESLGLAYPETEIRNNTVDFQLDLFSIHD